MHCEFVSSIWGKINKANLTLIDISGVSVRNISTPIFSKKNPGKEWRLSKAVYGNKISSYILFSPTGNLHTNLHEKSIWAIFNLPSYSERSSCVEASLNKCKSSYTHPKPKAWVMGKERQHRANERISMVKIPPGETSSNAGRRRNNNNFRPHLINDLNCTS